MTLWEKGGQITRWASNGLEQRRFGMIVDNSSDGLPMRLQRDYLPFEFYNGGCYPVSTEQRRGNGSFQDDSLNSLFRSTDPFVRNDFPVPCIGVKPPNGDSISGYSIVKPGALALQVSAPYIQKCE